MATLVHHSRRALEASSVTLRAVTAGIVDHVEACGGGGTHCAHRVLVRLRRLETIRVCPLHDKEEKEKIILKELL